MFNKRGLSAVVTTLILILLAMVLIGIIWVVIVNIVNQGTENIGIDRFTIDLDIQDAYANPEDGGNIGVVVKRSSASGDIAGVRFIFFDGVASITVDREISLNPLETRTFNFDASGEVAGIGVGDEVTITPLFETSEGKQEAGTQTDSRIIREYVPPVGQGEDEGEGEGENETEEEQNESETIGNECVTNSDCSEGEICSEDNVCIIPVAGDECNDIWDDGDIGQNECDGGTGCRPECFCEEGYSGDGEGNCILDPPVNIGTINSVWNKVYFDSHDLPRSSQALTDYIGAYVNFSDSEEKKCFAITFADYIADPSVNISYVRVDDIFGAPNIDAGEEYAIWEANNCGQ